MYRERFRFVYYLLAILATVAISAVLLGPVAFGSPVRVETQYRDTPALSSSSSVKDATARYGRPEQTIDGPDIGLPDGVICNVYSLADGVSLVCFQR